ncbi:MAG: TIGR02453 family protein [Myxococcota bacterium]
MPARGHFTPELFRFINDLKKHNDRAWFEANKPRYEQHVKAPLLAFIGDFGGKLPRFAPSYLADPRPVGGSMFRIYRDTRFAKDKSPYKTHASAHFRHQLATKNVHAPGFYLHLEPGASLCGVGMWHPEPEPLKLIRDRIVAKPKEWKAVREAFEIEGDTLKRPPAGYDAAHPFIDDLKRKDFITSVSFKDAEVTRADFLERFTEACQELAPLNRFLVQAVGLKW